MHRLISTEVCREIIMVVSIFGGEVLYRGWSSPNVPG